MLLGTFINMILYGVTQFNILIYTLSLILVQVLIMQVSRLTKSP